VRKQRRINIGVPAVAGQLLSAESRVIHLAEEIARCGILPDQLPWASEISKSSVSVPTSFTIQQAIDALRADFWASKVRTSAAERSWDRIDCELKRLPAQATITVDLLAAIAATTRAGSPSRVEACKVYKRLAKLAGLSDLDKLDTIRTPYEPAEREVPSDAEIIELLERTRNHKKYGWLTSALVTYGCRPSETVSLQPADDGTARVLTIKRKGKLPTWRTGLALQPEWVKQFEVDRVAKPWAVDAPAQYASDEARRLVQSWQAWLKAQAPGWQLYDLRHAWAVRSIRRGINASMAAKTMGHSLAVHHSTYNRWLEQRDVAGVAASLAG